MKLEQLTAPGRRPYSTEALTDGFESNPNVMCQGNSGKCLLDIVFACTRPPQLVPLRFVIEPKLLAFQSQRVDLAGTVRRSRLNAKSQHFAGKHSAELADATVIIVEHGNPVRRQTLDQLTL